MVGRKAYVGGDATTGGMAPVAHVMADPSLFGGEAQAAPALSLVLRHRGAMVKARLKACPFVLGFGGVLAGFSCFSYLLEYVATRLLIH